MCVSEADADHFLLDENRANRFLEVHKRGGELNMCPFAWEFHNEAGISSFPYKLNPLSLTQFAVKEECCVEGCDTEEMDEIIFKLFYSDHAYVSTNMYSHVMSSL